MPASAPRRTRRVVPVELPQDEVPEAFTAPKRQARRVQAATADPKVRMPEADRAVETHAGLVAPIMGRYFKLSEHIGLMPLMEWAAGREDFDPTDVQQLVGFYRILQDLVDPDEWAEFKQFTRENKCGDEEFVTFQAAAMEAITALPTEAPAAS